VISLPNIFLFNPTGDMALANGSEFYHAPKNLLAFEQALGAAPAFLAKLKDVVLVKELPSLQFLDFWAKHGLELCRFVQFGDSLANSSLLTEQLEALRPWSWNKSSHRLLHPLKSLCNKSFRESPLMAWREDLRQWSSREQLVNLWPSLWQVLPHEWLVAESDIPIVAKSGEEIEALLADWQQMVLKSPWSSSGRGVQMVRKSVLDVSRMQWIQSVLRAQGVVMVERLFDKIADFSIQFAVTDTEVKCLGVSRFTTNTNGGYLGNDVGVFPQTDYWLWLEDKLDMLCEAVSETLRAAGVCAVYRGALGVDMMCVRAADGKFRIHPLVELNLRPTMGLVALELERLLEPGVGGCLSMYFDPKLSFGAFCEAADWQGARSATGGLLSGIFPLSAPSESPFGLYLKL
jgi:hypothetical protein